MKVAALDLGTNTFLCLIAEGNEQGITKVHKDLVKVVRLGQGVDKTGQLHPEALERARECLIEFKKEIEQSKVDRILAMATSAARDAKNGQLLFDMGEELGIPIEVIPGEDEARISYLGATAGLTTSDKTTLVLDIGGGSTEFILGQGDKILFGQSLNIGGVRLTERFVSHQPVAESEQQKLNQYIKEQILPLLPHLLQGGANKTPDQILAVAGTPTSIVATEIGGFDEKKVDGYFLSRERLKYWVNEFAQTSVEEKQSKYQLGGRADIIFAGASILLNVVEALHMDGLLVSTKGVRYGVALEMLRNGANT